MIYSLTTQYAIRSLEHLCKQPQGKLVSVKFISKEAHVPAAYVSKIFLALTRAGILSSGAGRSGGFCVKHHPKDISLLDIINVLDDSKESIFKKCALGFSVCSDGNPCLLHTMWTKMSEKIMSELKRLTLSDLSMQSGLYPNKRQRPKKLSRTVRNLFQST